MNDTTIERCMMKLLADRDAGSSICPSDVARALAADEDAWRALMPAVRKVAARLAEAGVVRITRGEDTLSAGEIDHGPIRLRRGRGFVAQ
ncbi:DUF3253 domain-containing protein [Caballeronia sp. DA-9]|uniref:DUF3253 domain-containing protein n=1 Tax=Caballeronia sp. DA-9 TaxID=3436237 RepID=UPI003F67553F